MRADGALGRTWPDLHDLGSTWATWEVLDDFWLAQSSKVHMRSHPVKRCKPLCVTVAHCTAALQVMFDSDMQCKYLAGWQ